ncbi:glycoside hydrolase superfamily [Gorgonomyces haynaldii]|nr:glycoside hydrolase superfamily [Gorgonomyces haynaldii]
MFFATLVAAQFDINEKAVGVQLFQWPFAAIGQECVDFLGPNGYSYVQTSPVQAHIRNNGDENGLPPWWIVYQPISYEIGNRLGTEAQFKSMVAACKSVGVDVVVDVVLNHHPGVGSFDNKAYGPTSNVQWSAKAFAESFPGPGYTAEHYHDNECNGNIPGQPSDSEIFNCRLGSLVDLKTEHPYVRTKIIQFLNTLISYGVVGFRTDAAKHVPPSDWSAIMSGLTPTYAGKKPFFSQEVFFSFPDGSYKTYPSLGRVLNFDYGISVGKAFRNIDTSTDQLPAILNSLRLQGGVSTVFIENHDIERQALGHQSFAVSSENGGWWYRQAIAFNILYPFGLPIVHSGYQFTYVPGQESKKSPPSQADGTIIAPAFSVNKTCTNGWTCQHRYSDVYPLARVRTFMGKGLNAPVTVISAGRNQIYWSVAGRGFVAINSAQGGGTTEDMIVSLSTGLKQGTYCNMVYARNVNGKCVLWPGVTLNAEQVAYIVDTSGKTTVRLLQSDKSRVLALYADTDGYIPSSTVSQAPSSIPPSTTPTPSTPPPSSADSVSFKVTHDTGVGDSVYVVGTFNSWDACNPVKCNWSTGNVWQCGPISLTPGTVYQWKAVQYGTKTGTTCKNPVWQAGNNNQFTASANLVASTAY